MRACVEPVLNGVMRVDPGAVSSALSATGLFGQHLVDGGAASRSEVIP